MVKRGRLSVDRRTKAKQESEPEKEERDRTLRMPEMASRLTRPGSLQHLSASSRLSPGEQLLSVRARVPDYDEDVDGSGDAKSPRVPTSACVRIGST